MEAPTYVTLALLTLGYAVTVVVSLIEPVSLPYDLDRCITQHILQSNTSHTPPHFAEAFCVKKFILHNPNLRVKVNFTTDETDYIQSLFKQVEADAGVDTDKGRFKRQTGGWRRHRREIRSAPYLEWQQYVRAVTRLKRVQVIKTSLKTSMLNLFKLNRNSKISSLQIIIYYTSLYFLET